MTESNIFIKSLLKPNYLKIKKCLCTDVSPYDIVEIVLLAVPNGRVLTLPCMYEAAKFQAYQI